MQEYILMHFILIRLIILQAGGGEGGAGLLQLKYGKLLFLQGIEVNIMIMFIKNPRMHFSPCISLNT